MAGVTEKPRWGKVQICVIRLEMSRVGTGGGDSPRSVVISPGQGIARCEPQLSAQC